MSFRDVLLDVNVLIALIDFEHVAHEKAHLWFDTSGSQSWATCPNVENGVIRILGNPKYPNSPGSPAGVLPTILAMRRLPGHVFWADDISIVDDELVHTEKLLTPSQVTDSYLLALAVKREGKLATFDRRLSPAAVRGGKSALHFVDDQ